MAVQPQSEPVSPIVSSSPQPAGSETPPPVGLLTRIKNYIVADKLILGGLIFLAIIVISGLIALVLSPRSANKDLPFISIPAGSTSDNVTSTALPAPSLSASPSATASESASPSPSLTSSPAASSSASPSPS